MPVSPGIPFQSEAVKTVCFKKTIIPAHKSEGTNNIY